MLFHDVTTCHHETFSGYVEKHNAAHELKKWHYEVLYYNLNTAPCVKG
jgi:hypothetical protein